MLVVPWWFLLFSEGQCMLLLTYRDPFCCLQLNHRCFVFSFINQYFYKSIAILYLITNLLFRYPLQYLVPSDFYIIVLIRVLYFIFVQLSVMSPCSQENDRIQTICLYSSAVFLISIYVYFI